MMTLFRRSFAFVFALALTVLVGLATAATADEVGYNTGANIGVADTLTDINRPDGMPGPAMQRHTRQQHVTIEGNMSWLPAAVRLVDNQSVTFRDGGAYCPSGFMICEWFEGYGWYCYCE